MRGKTGKARRAAARSVFEPIRSSNKDTDDTIRQAKGHNAAWAVLCNN